MNLITVQQVGLVSPRLTQYLPMVHFRLHWQDLPGRTSLAGPPDRTSLGRSPPKFETQYAGQTSIPAQNFSQICLAVRSRCIVNRERENNLNPLMGTGTYSATLNNMKLVHWPLMGGLLHLVQCGRAWTGPQPAQALNSSPINGQHPSIISVLLYNGLLLCGFNG